MSGSGAGVGVVRSWGKTLQPPLVLEAGPGHTLPPVHAECSSLIVFLSLPLSEFISLTLSARSD